MYFAFIFESSFCWVYIFIFSFFQYFKDIPLLFTCIVLWWKICHPYLCSSLRNVPFKKITDYDVPWCIFLWFLVLGNFWTSWICRFIVSIKFGNFYSLLRIFFLTPYSLLYSVDFLKIMLSLCFIVDSFYCYLFKFTNMLLFNVKTAVRPIQCTLYFIHCSSISKSSKSCIWVYIYIIYTRTHIYYLFIYIYICSVSNLLKPGTQI